jgi:hypothetical protein
MTPQWPVDRPVPPEGVGPEKPAPGRHHSRLAALGWFLPLVAVVGGQLHVNWAILREVRQHRAWVVHQHVARAAEADRAVRMIEQMLENQRKLLAYEERQQRAEAAGYRRVTEGAETP